MSLTRPWRSLGVASVWPWCGPGAALARQFILARWNLANIMLKQHHAAANIDIKQLCGILASSHVSTIDSASSCFEGCCA